MAFVPDSKASVRLYAKHQRYARLGRLRYAAQKTAWLTAVGTQVSKTVAQLFPYLRNNSAYLLQEIGVAGNANTTITSSGVAANYSAGATETPGGDASDSTTN